MPPMPHLTSRGDAAIGDPRPPGRVILDSRPRSDPRTPPGVRAERGPEVRTPTSGGTAAGPEPDRPRVLLLDSDPVSRLVFGGTLDADERVSLIGAHDSRMQPAEWPVRRADLVILVSGPSENHVLKAQEIARGGVRSLLVGVDWTKHRLDAALSAGVSGCLSKGWALTHLPVAAGAAATGHVVFSPDLVELFAAMKPMEGVHRLAHRLRCLTRREREVLTLLAEGMSTSEVSTTLVVSPATIKSHVSHALTKLGVRNRLEAVLLMQAALGSGLQTAEF
ncbi:response regulator transcription factor [Streptomyces sp. NPDC054784]